MTGRPSIYEAIRYYTGGTYTPMQSIGYQRLQASLDASKYDAYQFCWYMGCFSGIGWSVLRRTSVMTSATYFSEFGEWKQTRLLAIRRVVRDSIEAIDAFIDSGVAINRVLTSDTLPFNAVMCVERALREMHISDGAYDVQPVLKKRAASAQERLLGEPEYLDWCPHIRREIDNKGEISGVLSPRH